MQTLLATSNLVLFFSLPFKPVGKVNFFFNGHIACALDGTVYQIVNPYLLKTDFLISIMPTQSWLFGVGGKWIDRDPASPGYRHVYLYRTCESTRTVVYGAGLSLERTRVDSIRDRFLSEDRRFRNGATRYNFFRYNCSSIIADALCDSGLAGTDPLNAVPSIFFRRFAMRHRGEAAIACTDRYDRARFAVRRLCFGLRGNPQRTMVRWAAGLDS